MANTQYSFFTLTNEKTTHTNDRSQRYATHEEAVEAAKERLGRGNTDAVYILQAVDVVKLKAAPVEIVPLEVAKVVRPAKPFRTWTP